MVFVIVFLAKVSDNVLGGTASGMPGHNGCILFLLFRHAVGVDRDQVGWDFGVLHVAAAD